MTGWFHTASGIQLGESPSQCQRPRHPAGSCDSFIPGCLEFQRRGLTRGLGAQQWEGRRMVFWGKNIPCYERVPST